MKINALSSRTQPVVARIASFSIERTPVIFDHNMTTSHHANEKQWQRVIIFEPPHPFCVFII